MTSEAEPNEISVSEFIGLRAKILAKGHRGLTNDEKADLLARTKRKERMASELFVMLHDRLVFRLVKQNNRKKFGLANVDMDEAMQEARFAVLRAAESFDPSKGHFSTYLYWWIRASYRHPNSGNPLIRIDPRIYNNGKHPKADDAFLTIVKGMVGIDDPISKDGRTPEETIASDEPDPEALYEQAMTEARTHETLRNAMATLSERERTLLRMRWSTEDGATLEEVGKVLNVTREGARLIEIKVFAKIRRHFKLAKVDPE